MIVYADILIVLNFIVDYLLLKGVSLLMRTNAKTFRIVLSALTGALSSLYIFMPQVSLVTETLFKIFVCFIMSLIAFGYGSFKRCLKSALLLFAVTCGYAGIMFALWRVFKPYGMVVNNGVVYLDISPYVLVFATVIAYFVFVFLFKIFGRTAENAVQCEVEIFADGKCESFSGILDTGNSVEDIFGNSEIIIADEKVLKNLFGETDIQINQKIANRYRIVPCSTVSGNDMLEAYRCDEAVITSGKRKAVVKKPVVAVAKAPINDGYMAVLNPKILE